MKKLFTLFVALAVVSLAAAGVGCGGGDDDEGTTTGAATAGGGKPVEIIMDDYKFTPAKATAPAGQVTITAPNEGDVEHELEILKTDQDPASFPVSGETVDVEALEEKGAEEIVELFAEPGESDEATVDLEPGTYAMLCNLPGHYQKGMYGTLTAK